MMNKLLYIYFKLPHDKTFGIISKVFNRLVAKIIKRVLDQTIPSYFIKTQEQYPNGLNIEKREKKIIVSFTSFPGRIHDVWIVVECLFRQTIKADKIILWLSESQFKDVEIPILLQNQIERGLEIRFVKGDLKSHKKYIYALTEFKNDYVITVDDDLYYDHKLIENLLQLKEKHPLSLPTNRAHKITFNKNNKVNLYSKWEHNYDKSIPSILLVPTGGFGTLYEFQQLNESFNNEKLITDMIPYADDLWLKIQTLLKNIKVVTNNQYNKDPLTVKSSQLEKLVTKNVIAGGNDVQLQKVLKYFGLNNLEKYKV
ncbi:MAG: glycosyltransferase [Flavobacterium sp.]